MVELKCSVFERDQPGVLLPGTDVISRSAPWRLMMPRYIVHTTMFRFHLPPFRKIIISFAQDGNFKSTIPNIKIDGRDIAQVCHSKLLGVIFSQDLTWNKQVDNIVKKASKRLYMLYQLKRAGITQKDLVSVYVSVMRPVLEYACSVWHTNLPLYLSDNIEVIQKRALKCIFPGLGYAEILRRVNLDTLNVRRDIICQNYFDKIKHID